MEEFFVPILEGDEKEINSFLCRVAVSFESEFESWRLFSISENDMLGKLGEIFAATESYFKMKYEACPVISVTLPWVDKGNARKSLEVTDSTLSVMLGVFLSAAAKITGWKVKDCWQSITATGTFSPKLDKVGNLCLEAIDNPKTKFDAFLNHANKAENKCKPGKKHLYIYISDETQWEADKDVIKADKNICVRSFSPTGNTLFDVLDYVFELPFLPDWLNDDEKEYFFDFLRKTEDIRRDNYIDSQLYHNSLYINILKDRSLFVYGPQSSGKSFFCVQLLKSLAWNRAVYKPLWIKICNDRLTEISIKPIMPELDGKKQIFELPPEIQNALLSEIPEIRDEESCVRYFNENKMVMVIDGLNLPDQLLDYFLECTEQFRDFIESTGSRMVFLSSIKHDKRYVKNLETISLPSFEKKSVLSFFYEISKSKVSYDKIIEQLKIAISDDNLTSDLENFEDLLCEAYGNYPHLLELISDNLFLSDEFDNKKFIKSLETNRFANLEEKTAICYNARLESVCDTNDDAYWILLYMLNYSYDNYVTREKLEEDLEDAAEVIGEKNSVKLKDIFYEKLIRTRALNKLISAGLIRKKYHNGFESIKIFDPLTYKVLLFGKYFRFNNLRKELVSEKYVLEALVFHFSTGEIRQKVLIEGFLKEFFDSAREKMQFKGKTNLFHGIARYCSYPEIFTIMYEIRPYWLFEKDTGRPVVDGLGQTALHYAGLNRNPEIALWLIRKADRCNIKNYIALKDITGNNILHYAAQFNPNVEVMKALLLSDEMTQELINSQNDDGITPFLYSIRFNANPEITRLLLNGTADDKMIKSNITLKTSKGQNAIHLCVLNPVTDMKIIGEKIDLIKNSVGEDLFRLLLAEKDFTGQAPLHYAAAWINDLTILKKIADPLLDIDMEDQNGLTPLHFAINYGNTRDVINFLINMGANVNKTDNNGRSSLFYAVYMGNPEMITYLVNERRADRNIQDMFNMTPLHLAVETGQPSIFIDLLFTPENINAKTNDVFLQSTPLLRAFDISTNEAQKRSVLRETVFRLIKNKADIAIADDLGNTPLHYAVMCGDSDVLIALITKDTINKINNQGYTPLALACSPEINMRAEIMNILVQEGGEF